MSDPKPEPAVPTLLPPQETGPAVTGAIRAEIPGVLAWLDTIDDAELDGVPPFDPATDLKPARLPKE